VWGGAGGSQARQLVQALPHSALTVAGRPLETLTVGATPLTPGACLEPGRTQLTQPAAVSTLYVLRGPDAGHAYPIPRGHTRIGRSQKNNQAVALNDPYLAPNHGTLVVDGSGARLILSHPPRSKNLAAWDGTDEVTTREFWAKRDSDAAAKRAQKTGV